MLKTQDSSKIATTLLCLMLVALSSADAMPKPAPGAIRIGKTTPPCDPKLAQSAYIGGSDVDGNPVVPADLDGGVAVDLSKLQVEPILGRGGRRFAVQDAVPIRAAPACAPAHRGR